MPARPSGRSLADFGMLKDAERKLLRSCLVGDFCEISVKRPSAAEKTPANVIRAGFIRFLILGGDDDNPVHEHGVCIQGAWIEDVLDLNGVDSNGDIYICACWFDQTLFMLGAHIRGNLILSESRIPGLAGNRLICDSDLRCEQNFVADGQVILSGARINGDFACSSATFNGPLNVNKQHDDSLVAAGIEVRGAMFLNNRFTANGTVRLMRSKIGKNLECTNADFNGPLKDERPIDIALHADAIDVGGAVYLHAAFKANGTVRLAGATIEGDLVCQAATFNGPISDEGFFGDSIMAQKIMVKMGVYLVSGFSANGTVWLAGATIGENFECEGATFNPGQEWSLNAERMSVNGAFKFRSLRKPADKVGLAFARAGVLADDAAAWGNGLVLEGFAYDRFSDRIENNAETRLRWLDKQRPERSGKNGKPDRFRPQPWLQLRKVLRETGHAEDARNVGIAFEDRRRHCGQVKGAAKSFHWIYGFFTGYGYRPMRLLGWSLAVWLACAVLYDYDAYRNKFIPADSSIYEDPSCRAAAAVNDAMPANPVFKPPCDGNYPTFSPLIYSLNVFLPVIELGQENAWAPATKPFSPVWWQNLMRPFTEPASFLQLVIWLETLLGWLAGLLLVAIVSGSARKQDD